MNTLKISWWNDHDLGEILYQDGYKNVIYLDVEVEKPEYNVTLESDLNGDNVEITKFRKWEKVYKFECWMQEDLVDAFTLMQIHDNIEVTLQSGDVIQVAKHGMRVETSWEDVGCLAKAVVSFAENYVVAANCDENMSMECYCEDTTEFWEIIDYSTINAYTPQTIPIVLAYTVEDIAGKKYTAELWEYASGWRQVVSNQYDCWLEHITDDVYINDGQFWQLFPGYIISITLISAFDYTLTGWILPGTFGTVYYNAGIGWIDAGTFTADEIASGAAVEIVGAGTIPVKIHVQNHSCDYDYTLEFDVVIPV